MNIIADTGVSKLLLSDNSFSEANVFLLNVADTK